MKPLSSDSRPAFFAKGSRPTSRRAARINNLFEQLESRQLMSAWTTVDPFHATNSNANANNAMTSDAAGNVYAAGYYHSTSSGNHGVIREQFAGTTTWTTIEDLPNASFKAMTIDSAGNLYVGGAIANNNVILERAAGATVFSVIDQQSTTGDNALAVDNAGDVFVAGVATTTNRQGAPVAFHWMVRERKAGQSAFVTVDDYVTTSINVSLSALTVINSGPNAGIYVAESYGIVRKSPTGAAGTWTTVDQISSAYGADAIAADPSGNLYVAAEVAESTSVHWVLQESTNGGQSWNVIDDYQLAANKYSVPRAIGFDLAGNVYVVGYALDSATHMHAIIRTNAGGTWQTIDDFSPLGSGTGYTTFTTDIFGNLYAGGAMGLVSGQGNAWITREFGAT